MPTTKAEIILDSVSQEGYRITTIEGFFPRYLLAELNTHRMIAKSAASSRAIPVKKRIKMVRDDPYRPSKWGENKPGMQADKEIDDKNARMAQLCWENAAQVMADRAEALDRLSVHKQQANRLLEPFVYVPAVMTATEMSNFFQLRDSEHADPEFQTLAYEIRKVMTESTPKVLDAGQWHAPYLTDAERESLPTIQALSISAARCARVSYKAHDGSTPAREDDLALAKRLLDAGHMSPFDHQAYPMTTELWLENPVAMERNMRQYVGWTPYRVSVEESAGMECRSFFVPRSLS